jgi:hypothetical protein
MSEAAQRLAKQLKVQQDRMGPRVGRTPAGAGLDKQLRASYSSASAAARTPSVATRQPVAATLKPAAATPAATAAALGAGNKSITDDLLDI